LRFHFPASFSDVSTVANFRCHSLACFSPPHSGFRACELGEGGLPALEECLSASSHAFHVFRTCRLLVWTYGEFRGRSFDVSSGGVRRPLCSLMSAVLAPRDSVDVPDSWPALAEPAVQHSQPIRKIPEVGGVDCGALPLLATRKRGSRLQSQLLPASRLSTPQAAATPRGGSHDASVHT
jgi:hypothetical protein